jgi:nickel-dependent lactate racemase
MSQGSTPVDILRNVNSLKEPSIDQWQVQILATILQQAEVRLFSSLMPDDVSSCHLQPINDLQTEIDRWIHSHGRMIKVAVLPDGPYAIPYVEGM